MLLYYPNHVIFKLLTTYAIKKATQNQESAFNHNTFYDVA